MQILKCIEQPNGWRNHPAVKQWMPYFEALALYYNLSIQACIARGFNNTLEPKHIEKPVILPHWFRDERFFASHRSNLLRKNAEWYGQFGWKEPNNLPYFWPTKEGY